ncbi:conserved hypothetical protein [Culex quinquefasciatus]|uniref:Uncharacterized protein n=1 Tax=Culex quinquefasciatus TaxID=7176 RepID=B0XI69_CULQU|nr:conserved hypothetical protein [Culex quinquefasciatus]|eukprot:XP_001869341.1 conserved hypothetical protein [Culex quinquefasciatus]
MLNINEKSKSPKAGFEPPSFGLIEYKDGLDGEDCRAEGRREEEDEEQGDNQDQARLGRCDLFEQVMIGKDTLLHLSGVSLGAACIVVIRGATQQIIDEADRSLHDALRVLAAETSGERVIHMTIESGASIYFPSDGRRDQTNLVSKNATGTVWDRTQADWTWEREVIDRWRMQHFDEHLNGAEAEAGVQGGRREDFIGTAGEGVESVPTMREVKDAIKKLKNNCLEIKFICALRRLPYELDHIEDEP